MADAATILAANGILIPDQMIEAAQAEGLDPAIAATVLMAESGGGANVWGHDTNQTGGFYTPGGPVTQTNYLAYRAAMRAGRIPRNGCGPAQCTSSQYQDVADELGGAWLPLANMRSGFRGLGSLIKQFGVQLGAQHYNGSGPAAVAYGQTFYAHYLVWKSRLAGTTIGGDELTPAQAQQLTDIWNQLLDLTLPWAGGISDKEVGQNPAPYSLLQYLLRVDVECHQTFLLVQEIQAELAALKALIDIDPVGPSSP